MPPAFWKYLTSLKGGEKFVLMWAHIASELDKPYATFSFQELMFKFKKYREVRLVGTSLE